MTWCFLRIAFLAIFKPNLLLAYTQLGLLILAHYISKILLGSTSAQWCFVNHAYWGLLKAQIILPQVAHSRL
jgi:hypothetical protein